MDRGLHSYQQHLSWKVLSLSTDQLMKRILACMKWWSRISTVIMEEVMKQVEHKLHSKGKAIYTDRI
jgi:hypothetical protein